MASIPYFVRLQGVIAAGGGTASPSYPVATLQTLHLNTLQFTSTGTFGIYSIRNTNGRIYTNASQATPILSAWLQQGASPNIGLLNFPYELVISGSDAIFIDLIDTSGVANTINLLLVGSLDLGG
jgi:hypothetical protein